MDKFSLQRRAAATHAQKAKQRRDSTVWTLTWRGGGSTQIVGYAALAAHLNIKERSIPVLLSKGGGTAFQLTRPSPLNGEPDVLTVTRLSPAKTKARRGRPPKGAISWQI